MTHCHVFCFVIWDFFRIFRVVVGGKSMWVKPPLAVEPFHFLASETKKVWKGLCHPNILPYI